MTRMDTYFRKTSRPSGHLSNSLKRPPPELISSSATTTTDISKITSTTTTTLSITKPGTIISYDTDSSPQTPPKTPRKSRPIARPRLRATLQPSGPQPKPQPQPERPCTPPNARIQRPDHPPPVRRKQIPEELRHKRRPTVSVKELFKTVHPLDNDNLDEQETPRVSPLEHISPSKFKPISPSKFGHASPNKFQHASPNKFQPISPSKIASGPLKGVSTDLLDLIRAKEAKSKETTPEQLRQRELLGIAADVARIVPNVFTANKREVMPYDRVVEKCHKGLRSNYNTTTIIECLDLMDKVAPEWVTVVEISRGRYMRLNKDKYPLPQLLKAIDRYKKEKNC